MTLPSLHWLTLASLSLVSLALIMSLEQLDHLFQWYWPWRSTGRGSWAGNQHGSKPCHGPSLPGIWSILHLTFARASSLSLAIAFSLEAFATASKSLGHCYQQQSCQKPPSSHCSNCLILLGRHSKPCRSTTSFYNSGA